MGGLISAHVSFIYLPVCNHVSSEQPSFFFVKLILESQANIRRIINPMYNMVEIHIDTDDLERRI